jgi:hypothetical protein
MLTDAFWRLRNDLGFHCLMIAQTENVPTKEKGASFHCLERGYDTLPTLPIATPNATPIAIPAPSMLVGSFINLSHF